MSGEIPNQYLSWGRFPKLPPRFVVHAEWRHRRIPFVEGRSYLPFGLGRSYGDSCLNSEGTIITTRYLSRLISFDPVRGLLHCEAGLSLDELIRFSVPRGWFLPVSPGTRFVTVGGAIANDIHGKNHHGAGTFGCHVKSLVLSRSDGTQYSCSPDSEIDLFRATIGGLGLTGLITEAVIQLRPIETPWIDQESIRFDSLDEFFELSLASSAQFDYTVAWLDCVHPGGRGIFMRGNHATRVQAIEAGKAIHAEPPGIPLVVPFNAPSWVLNTQTVKAFNWCYFHKQRRREVRSLQHHIPFFYPLDAVYGWNKIYGSRGFLQFQCVVPSEHNQRAIREILGTIVQSGSASFLAVLKEFGEVKSPGIMSFPRAGTTLCLDFAYQGEKTLALFRVLDAMVRQCGGALYPAKDAVMAPESFRQYFPLWRTFSEMRDPAFSSNFWRRVTGGTGASSE